MLAKIATRAQVVTGVIGLPLIALSLIDQIQAFTGGQGFLHQAEVPMRIVGMILAVACMALAFINNNRRNRLNNK